MNDDDKRKIQQWCETNNINSTVTLIVNSDPISEKFKEFASNIESIAKKLTINIKRDSDASEPYIEISKNLHFKSIPEGKSLESFFYLVGLKHHDFSNNYDKRINNINTPVFLKIYIATFCPFCPSVVKEITPLATINENIHITIIDGSIYADLTEKDNVLSAPTTIYDDTFRWSGTLKHQELIDVITNRDPSELSAQALLAMIESGKAYSLAEMMITENVVFTSFYDLLTHDKWPTRLGAMVVVEALTESHPELAENIVRELWERFELLDQTVKGDVIYMTGESGAVKHIKHIEKVLENCNTDELNEAAEEALERIKERFAQ